MIEQITGILDLLNEVDGIETSLIVDRDGILIASDSHNKIGYAESLASMFARAIYEFEKSTNLTQKNKSNNIHQLIIERQNDEKLVMNVTPNFILAVVTKGLTNIGLLKVEIKYTIEKLRPLLG